MKIIVIQCRTFRATPSYNIAIILKKYFTILNSYIRKLKCKYYTRYMNYYIAKVIIRLIDKQKVKNITKHIKQKI